MKILWITDDFLPHYGGSRLLYYHTIRHFPRGEVTVLTKRHPGAHAFDAAQPFAIRRGYFKRFKNPRWGDLLIAIEMLFRGAALLWRTRAEVIVCGELLPTAFVGRILSRVSGVPFIVYIHGEEMNVLRTLHGEKKIAFHVLRRTDAVIASSSIAYEEAVRQGVRPSQLYLQPPGVDEFFFTCQPSPERIRERFQIKGRRLLLTVGRLVERKGHAVVIGAFPDLALEFPDIVYLVVGTGPDEEKLKRIARDAGVSDRVIFAGRLPLEDLADSYAAADMFIMPHRELADGDTEGAGIVLLEAAAMGKPVIAGRHGGVGDSVKDGTTGFLIDTAGEKELVAKVKELLRDPGKRSRMGASGKMMVSRDRNWEDRSLALRKIIEEAILRRGRGSRAK